MSLFEQIIVPLIDTNIKREDLTVDAGFIDSFTSDPDRPTALNEFFLVFDGNVRTESSIDRAIRYNNSMCVVRKYHKYVNAKPYKIYSFWVKPELKNMYSGVITLSTEQKARILQFWGLSEKVTDCVLSNPVVSADVQHSMPCADYMKGFLDVNSLIVKKDADLNGLHPFYFLFINRNMYRLALIFGPPPIFGPPLREGPPPMLGPPPILGPFCFFFPFPFFGLLVLGLSFLFKSINLFNPGRLYIFPYVFK